MARVTLKSLTVSDLFALRNRIQESRDRLSESIRETLGPADELASAYDELANKVRTIEDEIERRIDNIKWSK